LSGLLLATVKPPANPLVELDLPESITQQYLASRPQPASTSHGLLFPTALQGSKVHLMRVLPARYVPSSGFGYPLDGLLPSNPCRSCFIPAALMGFTLRSVLLTEGGGTFPSRRTHMPFSLPLYPVQLHGAGPAGRGFWALTLPRVPGDDGVCLARPPLVAPLGFCPFRVSQRRPWPGLHPTSSHALVRTRQARPNAPQSFDRLPPPPCPILAANRE
jgi:hypothetical protein